MLLGVKKEEHLDVPKPRKGLIYKGRTNIDELKARICQRHGAENARRCDGRRTFSVGLSSAGLVTKEMVP